MVVFIVVGVLVYGAVLTVLIFYIVHRSVTRASRMMKELVKTGIVAPATIDKLEQTATRINNQPVLRFWVTAYPENRSPVQLVIKQLFSLVSIPQVGAQVVVAYNPEKPKDAIILSKEYTDKLGYTSCLNMPDKNTPYANELELLIKHFYYNPIPQHQQNVPRQPVDAFGTAKRRAFAEVIRVTDTGKNIKGHPAQSVLLQVKPLNGDSWEALLTLLAPSFFPYENGEIVEVAYDYADPQANIGILSRSPEYKSNARSKFTNIVPVVYRLLTINRLGYFIGNSEFLCVKAQAAFVDSVIEVEVVLPEPKGMTLQSNMNISYFCWREFYEKKAKLQQQKQGIVKVDSVEISELFWGQNPIVKLKATLENDGIEVLIDEPIHVLCLPEVGKHILIAYDPDTRQATALALTS